MSLFGIVFISFCFLFFLTMVLIPLVKYFINYIKINFIWKEDLEEIGDEDLPDK